MVGWARAWLTVPTTPVAPQDVRPAYLWKVGLEIFVVSGAGLCVEAHAKVVFLLTNVTLKEENRAIRHRRHTKLVLVVTRLRARINARHHLSDNAVDTL
jgi:hypothetical protein